MARKSMSPAVRAYTWRVAFAMAAYVLSLLLAVRVLGHDNGTRHDITAWVLALIPGLSVAVVFVAFGRLLIEERDEFVRLLLTRQSLIATGITMTVTTVYGFLENFGLLGHVDAFYVAMLWFVGLGVGGLVNKLTFGTEGGA
jgi:hypothetical protein